MCQCAATVSSRSHNSCPPAALLPAMAAPARTGPLANVVVIALTRQLAGPQASRIL